MEAISEVEIRDFIFRHLDLKAAVRLEVLPGKPLDAQNPFRRQEDQTKTGSDALSVPSGTDHITRTPLATREPLSLPLAETFRLSNNLKIYHIEKPHAPFLILSLVCHSGLDEDPEQIRGLSAFLNHYLIDSKRELEKMSRQVELSAIRIGHTNLKNGTNITLTTTQGNTSMAFDYLGQLIRTPQFDSNLIERQKNSFISSLRANIRLPVFAAYNILQRAIFGNEHSYGYWNYGRPETLRLITQDKLRTFHDSNYTPDNTALVVIGNIESDETIRLADKFFGDWRGVSKRESCRAEARADETQRFVFDMPELPVTTLLIGQHFRAKRSPRDDVKFLVLDHIIQNTLNSRLEEILGPGIHSQSNIGLRKQTGFLSIKMMNLDSNLAGKIENKIINHLVDLTMSPVNHADLELAKQNAVREVISEYISSSNTAKSICQLFVYDLPDNHDQTLLEKIQSVSCDDMLELSKKYIVPADLKSVFGGPAERIEPRLVERQTRYLSVENYDDFFVNLP